MTSRSRLRDTLPSVRVRRRERSASPTARGDDCAGVVRPGGRGRGRGRRGGAARPDPVAPSRDGGGRVADEPTATSASARRGRDGLPRRVVARRHLRGAGGVGLRRHVRLVRRRPHARGGRGRSSPDATSCLPSTCYAGQRLRRDVGSAPRLRPGVRQRPRVAGTTRGRRQRALPRRRLALLLVRRCRRGHRRRRPTARSPSGSSARSRRIDGVDPNGCPATLGEAEAGLSDGTDATFSLCRYDEEERLTRQPAVRRHRGVHTAWGTRVQAAPMRTDAGQCGSQDVPIPTRSLLTGGGYIATVITDASCPGGQRLLPVRRRA